MGPSKAGRIVDDSLTGLESGLYSKSCPSHVLLARKYKIKPHLSPADF